MSDREQLLAEAKKVQRDRLLTEAKRVQAERQEKLRKAEADRPGMAESAMRGAGQGLSFGLADELYGAVGAVVNPTNSEKGFADRYRDSRDYARRQDAKSKAANPKTYGGAEIGGGVATAFVPGLGALNAAKGAKAGVVMGKAAATGGATGLGLSEADVTRGQVPEALVDTAIGAGIGGATAGAMQGIAKKLSPAALKHLAERRAAKAAIGNQGKVYDELTAKGTLGKVGRDLLDEGAVKFGDNAEAIARRSSEGRNRVGKEIGSLLGKVDDDAAWAAQEGFGIADDATANAYLQSHRQLPGAGADGHAIAEKIRAYADKIESPNNKALVENLRNQAYEFSSKGVIPLKESNRLKKSYRWKFGENQSLNQEATNTLKGIVGDEMEEAVGRSVQAKSSRVVEEPLSQFSEQLSTGTGNRRAAPSSTGRQSSPTMSPVLKEGTAAAEGGAPDALTHYKGLKGKYASFETASKAARKLGASQEKNRTFSPTDYIVGGAAGTASMNPVTGLAVATGNKVLRERGSAAVAVTLDKVAKALEAGGQALGPKWGPILAKAAKNGHLAAVHAALMKNQPEYAELVGANLPSGGAP